MTSKPERVLPTLWQTVLAAITGIAIGVCLSWALDDRNAQQLVMVKQSAKKQIGALFSGDRTPFGLDKVDVFPKLTKRTNILLMGVDSNGRNTLRFQNTRSDTMIVACLDPSGDGKVGLISIPRDSRVHVPDHGVEKINSAHAIGGPELAVETVEQVFSIPIDHYVVIDTQGLRDVCEVIGPIEVAVEKRMRYRDRASGLDIDLKPGLQELSPEQVEEYLRFRYDSKGDIGRISRQQWFLRQAQHKLKDPTVVLKLPDVIRIASEYVVTDMGFQDMARLIGFGRNLQPKSIQTAMLPGEAAMINGGSYWVPDPEATALVIHRLTGMSPSVSRIANNTIFAGREIDPFEEDMDEEEEIPTRRRRRAFSNDSLQAAWAASYSSRPFSVVLRYPRGQEQTARDFEQALEYAGYRIRSRVRVKPSECQHEKIALNSFRADDSMINALKQRFPELEQWAVAIEPIKRTRTDMTIQLSPDTVPLIPCETAKASFDYEISDIVSGEVKPGKG